MYQLPCGGPNEHGAGGACQAVSVTTRRHAMGGIRAAEQLAHTIHRDGRETIECGSACAQTILGARLADVAPPHGVFTDLVPDNEFIFWRSSCSRAGVAGEYAVFEKGTVAAAQACCCSSWLVSQRTMPRGSSPCASRLMGPCKSAVPSLGSGNSASGICAVINASSSFNFAQTTSFFKSKGLFV